jgi:cyanophycinase-like exopeptidase
MLGSAVAGCSAGAMAMGFDVPNFFRPVHDGITGFNFVGKIRTIPHFDKYFGWVPDSAAKFVTRAPANTTVLGIDELTALANGIDSDNWQVYGLGHVHLLKGDPLGKFSAGHRFLGGSLS